MHSFILMFVTSWDHFSSFLAHFLLSLGVGFSESQPITATDSLFYCSCRDRTTTHPKYTLAPKCHFTHHLTGFLWCLCTKKNTSKCCSLCWWKKLLISDLTVDYEQSWTLSHWWQLKFNDSWDPVDVRKHQLVVNVDEQIRHRDIKLFFDILSFTWESPAENLSSFIKQHCHGNTLVNILYVWVYSF